MVEARSTQWHLRDSVVIPRANCDTLHGMSSKLEANKRITYRYERMRAVGSGILETAGSTFLLLIAVRHFQAGSTAKALVAMGGNAGLLMCPLVVSWVS